MEVVLCIPHGRPRAISHCLGLYKPAPRARGARDGSGPGRAPPLRGGADGGRRAIGVWVALSRVDMYMYIYV